MKYLPLLLILLGVVMLMAGPGQKGLRTAESIALVVAGLIVLFFLISLLIRD